MRRELISGTITNVPQQVSKVFHSEARYISLVIGEPRNHYTVCVSRFEKSEFSAYVTAESNPEREQAVRAVLGAYNLEVPPLSGTPSSFYTGIPFQFMYHIAPIPSRSEALSEIITDLFVKLCGADDKSELSFFYCESIEPR